MGAISLVKVTGRLVKLAENAGVTSATQAAARALVLKYRTLRSGRTRRILILLKPRCHPGTFLTCRPVGYQKHITIRLAYSLTIARPLSDNSRFTQNAPQPCVVAYFRYPCTS